MKHIFVNLKRFDVPRAMGGVNGIADIRDWGPCVIEGTQDALEKYRGQDVEFAMFFPELHILTAAGALKQDSMIQLGCQGVYGQDVQPGGNFGAFTTDRPAAAMKAAGCGYVIVGHCEERNHIRGVLEEAGCGDTAAQGRILNAEIQAAAARGMKVLYCIGEKSEELERWEEVLGEQLESGLSGVDKSMVTVAYEPIWSIGPGKTPAGKEYITKIAKFVKEKTGGMDVVYGGGLKQDNAAMLASIPEIDGGLIALTRFQGEIGFYPEEYLEIVKLYLGN
ncbi:MAG TPA: triosephosphate isomerase [Candidatus Scatomonas pullistercoris]|uniref:Triosephosphate isomerase n=1 Tax=Candidatus Scatomonas pullistercoris TaxID=2840920 RepID=A0A9D1P3Z6_9FIRM|nr:triosephosphate isomerase [Candidatus Scatomonas pullistercoris]